MDRTRIIIRTSVIGILANVFLAAFKAGVGVLSHSIAIVMDAVNNLSDALSSLITIIGTKLAGKKPDRKHPLGHGRMEYLSAAIISLIVLYAGVTSLTESVKKIIHPRTPEYSLISLIIIAVAVTVKILMGNYVRRTGERVHSDSLIASGKDAMFDAVISFSTLAAALIFIYSGISLEAPLGAVISLVIIWSGFDMLRGTISEILGERVDSELARAVKRTVCSFPQVNGAYDLILHSYGPGNMIGSVHIEVPDTMTIDEADRLEREIAAKVYEETKVSLTGISVYSMNTQNEKALEISNEIRKVLNDYTTVLQMHGFYLEEENKTITFDMIISFDEPDRWQLVAEVTQKLEAMFPGYTVCIQPDYDISE